MPNVRIRTANIDDLEDIKRLYLAAFDQSESEIVANVAVDLLNEKQTPDIINLVAVDDEQIIGHVSFSPIFLKTTGEHLGYILAPLAVLPEHQKMKIGTSLVEHGVDLLAKQNSYLIFVYGDPGYYGRFGFASELASAYQPPHTLQQPQGWLAKNDNAAVAVETSEITCVNALNDPDLW